MKTESDLFKVHLPSLESYISGKSSINHDEQYSVIKNARREENEIAEICSALGSEYVMESITFNLRRLALFETITITQTEIKLQNDQELIAISSKIYKDVVVPFLKYKDATGVKFEDRMMLKLDQEIQNNVDDAFNHFIAKESGIISHTQDFVQNEYFTEIEKVYKTIQERKMLGLYTPGELSFDDDLVSITKKVVFDKFYNKYASKLVNDVLYPKIMEVIEEKKICYPRTNLPIEKLSLVQNNNRHTFLLAGPPASGKSTSYAMVTLDAEALDVNFSDIMKCNTDVFRQLVSKEEELGQNLINHASFNYNEAYLITKNIYKRIRERLENYKDSAHLLIDSVYPTQDKIDMGTIGSGNLHIYFVSVPAEVGLERALKRGEISSRYTDVENLLRSHRDISKNFCQILINNKEKKIDYTLVDNDVLPGQIPILVAEGNLAGQEIKIYNLDKYIHFINKENINVTANQKNELYFNIDEGKILEHFEQLNKANFRIQFQEANAEEKLNAIKLRNNTKRSLKNNSNSYNYSSNIINTSKSKKLLINKGVSYNG